MLRCRVGAHTFVFQQYGYDQAVQTRRMLEIVAESGYQAVEFHQTALNGDDYGSRITEAAHQTGLEVVGASHGQPLWNRAEHDRIFETMDFYSDKLSDLGADLKCGMTCSGKPYAERSEAENEHLLEVWAALAEVFQARDAVLLYHNHGEPMDDVRHVVENVPLEVLSLGPDLDWLRVGGIDPLGFLRDHADRISLIHVRDYHTGGDRTEALGEGDANFGLLKEVLEKIDFTGDLVVELALPSGSAPDRTVQELLKISRDHIRGTLGI